MNRQALPPMDRATDATEVPLKARLREAEKLYPPTGTACQACWLQGVEAQIRAARAGTADPATPTARDHQHCRASFDSGAAAVRTVLAG